MTRLQTPHVSFSAALETHLSMQSLTSLCSTTQMTQLDKYVLSHHYELETTSPTMINYVSTLEQVGNANGYQCVYAGEKG
jgi:hypothetical protein